LPKFFSAGNRLHKQLILALPAPDETKTSFAVNRSPLKGNHQGHIISYWLLFSDSYQVKGETVTIG